MFIEKSFVKSILFSFLFFITSFFTTSCLTGDTGNSATGSPVIGFTDGGLLSIDDCNTPASVNPLSFK